MQFLVRASVSAMDNLALTNRSGGTITLLEPPQTTDVKLFNVFLRLLLCLIIFKIENFEICADFMLF
jgi:hypothetical protein